MSRRSLLLLVMLGLGATRAQAAASVGFTGHLTDATGTPLSGVYTMSFRVFAEQSGGAPLCEDTDIAVEVVGGELSTLFALPASALGALENAYLEVEIEGETLSRLPMGASPFTVSDSLRRLTCQAGEVPTFDGAAWQCQAPSGGGFGLSCPAEGDLPKIGADGNWTCGQDREGVTSVSANASSPVSVWTDLLGHTVVVGLKTNSIDETYLDNDSVGTYEIKTDGVGAAEIASGAVGTAELGSGAVTGTKLADGAVTGAKLADGAVTSAKVAPSVLSMCRWERATADWVVNAYCDDGDFLIGGGCDAESAERLTDSMPWYNGASGPADGATAHGAYSSSWHCDVSGGSVTAYALCCDG